MYKETQQAILPTCTISSRSNSVNLPCLYVGHRSVGMSASCPCTNNQGPWFSAT